MSNHSALDARSLFNVDGVAAVVTGGGTGKFMILGRWLFP
jgi:hypothetical protein